MLRCSMGLTLALALACGGGGEVEPDPGLDALATWSAKPAPWEPDIELRLILDDRVAVYAGGKHTGELSIPAVPAAGRGASRQVHTRLDLDEDGYLDLGFRDDDASGTINVMHAWFRYDHSAKSYARCTDLDGWKNLEAGPDGGLRAHDLANGVGSSGTTTFFRSDGGCGFAPVAELTWDVDLGSGNGTASCRLWSEPEPQWRMPVRERPDRPCPEAEPPPEDEPPSE